MFGVVPKALWEKQCPADQQNRIAMACQSLLLRRDDRVILIDAGLGSKWTSKQRAQYAIEPSAADAALSQESLRDAVTDVVVTHLHFDHAGGLTYRGEDGELRPCFPNARHWIQAEHLDWALSPTEKDRGSFPSENIAPLKDRDLFHLVRGEEEIFSGLQVMPLYGHTKAMQAVLIHGPRPLFFPADLLPMRAHLHLPYIMAYDIEPLTTLAEKKRVLDRAFRENWLLYLEHEPDGTLGAVTRFDGKYAWGTV